MPPPNTLPVDRLMICTRVQLFLGVQVIASYAALSSLSQTMRSCGSVGCLIRYLRNLPPGPGNRFVTT